MLFEIWADGANRAWGTPARSSGEGGGAGEHEQRFARSRSMRSGLILRSALSTLTLALFALPGSAAAQSKAELRRK